MKLSFAGFQPLQGDELVTQLINCLGQLIEFVSGQSLDLEHVINLTLFIDVRDKLDYQHKVDILLNYLPASLRRKIPVLFLAQAPASGYDVSMEIMFISEPANLKFIPKLKDGILYLVVEDEDQKLLVASLSSKEENSVDLAGNAESVFNKMERILKSEGLGLNHIFRQWNYIENITATHVKEGKTLQNYQLFNEVRAAHYAKYDFKDGYPSSTGIGIKTGGITVSFLAATDGLFIRRPLENPLQKSAFEYNENVLIGASGTANPGKSSPKFSRAMLIEKPPAGQMFVSGTASIRGQETLGEDSIEIQTETTLENIMQLLQMADIRDSLSGKTTVPEIRFLRVYIKYQKHEGRVREICKKHLGDVSSVYVLADVCRENLLVEIEAFAS